MRQAKTRTRNEGKMVGVSGEVRLRVSGSGRARAGSSSGEASNTMGAKPGALCPSRRDRLEELVLTAAEGILIRSRRGRPRFVGWPLQGFRREDGGRAVKMAERRLHAACEKTHRRIEKRVCYPWLRACSDAEHRAHRSLPPGRDPIRSDKRQNSGQFCPSRIVGWPLIRSCSVFARPRMAAM